MATRCYRKCGFLLTSCCFIMFLMWCWQMEQDHKKRLRERDVKAKVSSSSWEPNEHLREFKEKSSSYKGSPHRRLTNMTMSNVSMVYAKKISHSNYHPLIQHEQSKNQNDQPK